MDNIYLGLTRLFNEGSLRAVISSGQAVVLHRLAIMSKDGDWILREDQTTLVHVLGVLAGQGARYRFGAPLDLRWLSGGWSSHLEFKQEGLRIRTDFVTRPPRLSALDLKALWREQEGRPVPFVNARHLAELKKTNREKDFAVIGELARRMPDPRDQLLYSRSSRDLEALARRHPDLLAACIPQRPLLAEVPKGREALETALDAERRRLMRINEERLAGYVASSRAWAEAWPALDRIAGNLPLMEAHRLITQKAEGLLPFSP